jgi:hypothetical protein
MSVNIGSEAVNAIQELRGNAHFERLVAALGVFAQTRMLAAMETDPTMRTDATAHARGMYHLWQALHSAHAGLHMSQVKPPPLAKNARTAAGNVYAE